MKKKFVFVVLLYLFLLNTITVQAKAVIAETLADFDSTNPPSEFAFKIINDVVFDKKNKLEKDCVIKGEIVKIVPPKRLKKNAYFVFGVKSYTIPSQEHKIIEISNVFAGKAKVKPYVPINKAEVAGSIATTAVGVVVKGFSEGVSFIEGAAKAKEGENRLGAGVKSVYEDSPLSYCNKGADLCLKVGDKVKFSLDKDLFEE